MYEIYFYRNRDGKEPVMDFMRELESGTDKASRITLGQFIQSIRYLREYGTRAGGKVVKHLDGEIWELRPDRYRVMFAAWHRDGFVLLHTFLKRTRKTPPREIAQAKRELDYMKECERNERKQSGHWPQLGGG